MEFENVGSLSRLPFFKGKTEKEIITIIKEVKQDNIYSFRDNLYYHIENSFNFHDKEYQQYSRHHLKELFYTALDIELVKYGISACLHKYLLDEEDSIKIETIIEKNQFNSKLVKLFLNRIINLTKYNELVLANYISVLLELNVNNKLNELILNKIKKDYKPLKDVIDTVASGVNVKCYLELDRTFADRLPDELNDYIDKKYNYNFNKLSILVSLGYHIDLNVEVLDKTLVNDEEFWSKLNIRNFTFKFLQLVLKYNGLKHAEKIIDYIFGKLLSNEQYKFIINNQYNLCIGSNEVREALINRCIKYTFGRFEGVVNFNLTNDEKNNLMYPLVQHNIQKEIALGKELFNEFIVNGYNDDSNKVLDIFKDPYTIVQKSDNIRKRTLSLGILLDASMFGYHDENKINDGYTEEKAFYYNCYNFKDKDSILNRFYYRVYLINKYSKNLFAACLYEVLYDTLNVINDEFKLRCSYLHNDDVRDSKYNALKDILAKYNVNINEEHKHNYIVALLDRKTASMDEISMFSELEEIGDAIYELAIVNILFYQNDDATHLNYDELNNLKCAKSQIEVSKFIGLDNLYISSFNCINFNNKYDSNDLVHFRKDNGHIDYNLSLEHNYIADSLEMIIGAIYKDLGINKALEFATNIILDANPIYKNYEVKEYNEDEVIMSNDIDYYERLFPSYTNIDSYYNKEYHHIQHALEKVFKVIVIGNETIEKRNKNRFISLDDMVKNISFGPYKVVCYYLRYKIIKTLDYFKDIILNNI